MKIIVCIKQVPAASQVKIDPDTGRLIREGVDSVLNPFDYHALEAALQLKENHHAAEIVALSMGPGAAENILREALALGADRAVLLSDRSFAGSDTWSTGYILSLAVKKLGGADLILCGKQAVDGDTAQVGPELAAQLDYAQSCSVVDFEFAAADTLLVTRLRVDGHERLAVRLPAVLAVERELNMPRVPALKGYLKAARTGITVWNAFDLAADAAMIGLAGSPTRVVSSRGLQFRKRNLEIIRESPGAAARRLGTFLAALKEGVHHA